MIFWFDAQLSPGLARWTSDRFGIAAVAVRDLGLRDAADEQIFNAARQAQAVVITQDRDFIELLTRLGKPPQVIWLTCGNTSNARVREIFESSMTDIIRLLEAGEPLIELHEKW